MMFRKSERLFCILTAGVLLLGLASKFWMLLTIPKEIDTFHPLFPFATNAQIAVTAMLVEGAVLSGMLFARDTIVRVALPTSLFLVFLIYRIGLYAIHQSFDCGCFGNLHQLVGLSSAATNKLALACSIIFPSVGIFLLTLDLKTRICKLDQSVDIKNAPTPRLSRRKRRILLWLIGITLFIFLLPAAQVAYVGIANPLTTMPAIIYGLRAKEKQLPPPRLTWMNETNVPQEFVVTLIQQEDGKFCQHFGFDFYSIGFSLRKSSETGNPPAGASTITQQCARSLFLWQGRSWVRKGFEAYYTIWMECLLSKRRIFELYLNVIEFADGIYGVEAGSQYHFTKSIVDLTPDQMSRMLAVMPNPRRWTPQKLPPSSEFRRLNIEREVKALKENLRNGEKFPISCLRR